MDLLGLDRFQESLRAVDIVIEWNKMVTGWQLKVQDVLVLSGQSSIGFAEVDSMVEQIVRELGPKLQLVNREKKKYRDQVKTTHECLNVTFTQEPSTNPSPSILLPLEDVVKDKKRKRKEERRVKRKKTVKEPEVFQETEIVDRTAVTPTQQLTQELEQLEYLLQQQP